MNNERQDNRNPGMIHTALIFQRHAGNIFAHVSIKTSLERNESRNYRSCTPIPVIFTIVFTGGKIGNASSLDIY